MLLPEAPSNVSTEFTHALSTLAELWGRSKLRPKIDSKIEYKWRNVIDEWIESDIPLLIRKNNGNDKGSVHTNEGRKFIIVDNSPAQWAYALAFHGRVPELGEIRDWLVGEDNLPPTVEEIPIAMVLTANHRNDPTRYQMRLLPEFNLNKLGWKLAHIESIGIRMAGDIERIEVERLKTHFRLLMSPSNMFVIPKHLAGLAEVPEFLEHFRERLNS